jgi:hypothetical protein
MGITVSRLSHTRDQWRRWGNGGVEISGTRSGVSLEFTRPVGRGAATFKIELDEESLKELVAAMKTSRPETEGS